MTFTSKIATIAALATVLAGPAFAGDQDLATELQDSGRYFGTDYTVNRPNVARTFGGAYASAVRPAHPHAFVIPSTSDFQAQGR
jgi:hypothetical protein